VSGVRNSTFKPSDEAWGRHAITFIQGLQCPGFGYHDNRTTTTKGTARGEARTNAKNGDRSPNQAASRISTSRRQAGGVALHGPDRTLAINRPGLPIIPLAESPARRGRRRLSLEHSGALVKQRTSVRFKRSALCGRRVVFDCAPVGAVERQAPDNVHLAC
jgi:hypothetical protein